VARVHQVLGQKWINKGELARRLQALGHRRVSEETLNRWVRRKEDIDPPIVRALERITGLRLGETENAPRPAWAEGLVTKADLQQMIAESIIPLAAAQTISALREAGLLPPVEPVPDNADQSQ
jgi:hypothetical protein